MIWTLIHELSRGGLTFFGLTEEADQGPMFAQTTFSVSFADDAGTLYEKIKEGAAELLTGGEQIGVEWPDFRVHEDSIATVWRKRMEEEDGLIRWDEGSRSIYNLIRALKHP